MTVSRQAPVAGNDLAPQLTGRWIPIGLGAPAAFAVSAAAGFLATADGVRAEGIVVTNAVLAFGLVLVLALLRCLLLFLFDVWGYGYGWAEDRAGQNKGWFVPVGSRFSLRVWGAVSHSRRGKRVAHLLPPSAREDQHVALARMLSWRMGLLRAGVLAAGLVAGVTAAGLAWPAPAGETSYVLAMCLSIGGISLALIVFVRDVLLSSDADPSRTITFTRPRRSIEGNGVGGRRADLWALVTAVDEAASRSDDGWRLLYPEVWELLGGGDPNPTDVKSLTQRLRIVPAQIPGTDRRPSGVAGTVWPAIHGLVRQLRNQWAKPRSQDSTRAAAPQVPSTDRSAQARRDVFENVFWGLLVLAIFALAANVASWSPLLR